MKLMRAASLTVSSLAISTDLYCEWLDYSEIETGTIDADLARSWGAPNSAGCPYAILQPQSGASVYIRMIEQPVVDQYVPLTSFGWGAIEINNQDTLGVNARLENSPFEIIGPPKELDGLPEIFPMQIKGPDQEIVYLTQFRGQLPMYDLPPANSFIDKLFILVMACSDMTDTGQWLEKHLLIEQGEPMELMYDMISTAFNLPPETKHTIATLKHERDVFLEIDALPANAIERPRHNGMLPPCAAIGSFIHPNFDALEEINKDLWITPPKKYAGAVYNGKRAATLQTPDGTLIELIEA